MLILFFSLKEIDSYIDTDKLLSKAPEIFKVYQFMDTEISTFQRFLDPEMAISRPRNRQKLTINGQDNPFSWSIMQDHSGSNRIMPDHRKDS